MHCTPKKYDLNKLKLDLHDSIVKNNYNLLSPEVLALSIQIDELVLPIFQAQLDFYRFYKRCKN
jgi:hypothetical protein